MKTVFHELMLFILYKYVHAITVNEQHHCSNNDSSKNYIQVLYTRTMEPNMATWHPAMEKLHLDADRAGKHQLQVRSTVVSYKI